jgi:hypothetical protein
MTTIVNRLVNSNIRENPRIQAMELTGDILVGAPRDKVWAALNDPDILRRCIPGCEHIDVISPSEKHVRVLVRVGPVRARFVGKIKMDQVRPNQGCVLHFEGSGGAAGMASGQSSVELADESGGTRLRYTAQASVGGKLGQIGGRMMDAAAKQMADQFFKALNREMGAAAPAALLPVVAGAPATAGTAPLPALAAAGPGGLQGEWLRVLWFALGSLSTGFGVWLASRF